MIKNKKGGSGGEIKWRRKARVEVERQKTLKRRKGKVDTMDKCGGGKDGRF